MVHRDRRGLVRLSPMVKPETHAQAYINAKAAGITVGLYITRLIEQDQLDDNGVPLWRVAEIEAEEKKAAEEEGKQLPLTG
ncbi:hypothetical protein ACIRO1_45410 [Streptomyces sp. NPDC102381]|uniref:hypothetical protein n=1 Tax=Streptomyces sp. NPDC102381 TaxID=3366164 RepID=UPI00381D79B2